MMIEANGACCSLPADRLTNDALVALMADVIERGARPCARIVEEATSVFTAFYRGQALAARVGDAEPTALVSTALATLHRRCNTFDRQIPFRAWLLEIARLTLIEYQRDKSSVTDAAGTAATDPRDGLSPDRVARIRNHELYPAPVC